MDNLRLIQVVCRTSKYRTFAITTISLPFGHRWNLRFVPEVLCIFILLAVNSAGSLFLKEASNARKEDD